MLCSQIGIKFSHLLESLFYCIDEAKVKCNRISVFHFESGSCFFMGGHFLKAVDGY